MGDDLQRNNSRRRRFRLSVRGMMASVAVISIVVYVAALADRSDREQKRLDKDKIDRATVIFKRERPDLDLKDLRVELGTIGDAGMYQEVNFYDRRPDE